MQYNQQYNSMNNIIAISPHYTSSPTTCNSSYPLSVQLASSKTKIPSTNNKRSKISSGNGSSGKRTKTDSNGNQSTSGNSLPISLMKTEDDGISQIQKRVPVNQGSESEYTDISNIKSYSSSFDDESLEQQGESRSNSLVEGCVDQGKIIINTFINNRVACLLFVNFSSNSHLSSSAQSFHFQYIKRFIQRKKLEFFFTIYLEQKLLLT